MAEGADALAAFGAQTAEQVTARPELICIAERFLCQLEAMIVGLSRQMRWLGAATSTWFSGWTAAEAEATDTTVSVASTATTSPAAAQKA